jgi:uncharacterized membrane protein YkoI
MGQGIVHVFLRTSVLKQGTARVLALLLLLLTVGLANDDHEVARRLRDTGDIVPVERILQTLSRVHPVRVLEITLREEHGSFVYTVEYVDAQGVVWKRQYDAKSGGVLHTGKGKEP